MHTSVHGKLPGRMASSDKHRWYVVTTTVGVPDLHDDVAWQLVLPGYFGNGHSAKESFDGLLVLLCDRVLVVVHAKDVFALPCSFGRRRGRRRCWRRLRGCAPVDHRWHCVVGGTALVDDHLRAVW